MSRLLDLFRWEYRVEQRHYLLLLSAVIGAAHLFFAAWKGDVPLGLTIAAMAALVASTAALAKASQSERWTITAWGLVLMFSLTPVINHAHASLAPHVDAFRMAHPLGAALGAVQAVAMLLVGISIAMLLVSWVRGEVAGGSGGETVEERVLSAEEYDDFDPVEDDGRAQAVQDETPRPD